MQKQNTTARQGLRRGLRLAGMTAALLLAMVIGAYAGSNNETISALLNRSIKITYDGEVQSFYDVTGTQVYPLSYQGTTYLPVRAVSTLLGISVDWDGETNTVILESEQSQPVELVKQKNFGETKYSQIITDKSQLSYQGDEGTQTFENGILWNQWNGSMSYSRENVCLFDCAGYDVVSFQTAATTMATVYVLNQNGDVMASFESKPNQLVSKKIELNGVTRIGFASDFPAHASESAGKNGYVYIFEPLLS